MNVYMIKEKDLLNLLEDNALLRCLEQAGVDNWSGYMYNREDFLCDELDVSAVELEENDYDFDTIAEQQLKNFVQISGSYFK